MSHPTTNWNAPDHVNEVSPQTPITCHLIGCNNHTGYFGVPGHTVMGCMSTQYPLMVNNEKGGRAIERGKYVKNRLEAKMIDAMMIIYTI